MKWERIGRGVYPDGGPDTIYKCDSLRIESRKRAYKHANGNPGCWYHTTYFLILPAGTEMEYYSLADAKEAAEKRGAL